jgi:hypothetical protein
MGKAWIAAALLLALPSWGLDVRPAALCAVHLARHPGYEEPLDAAPVLFVGVGLELREGDTAFALDGSVGPAREATDAQVTFAFRHALSVDWGLITPFLQAGAGWAGRFSGGLTMQALFPEAAAGIEAGRGPFAAQLLALYRPVPLRLFEAEEFPLRRIGISARLLWAPGQRGR